MKICMIINNMNDFGGLEEFAKNLAIGIQQQGHEVSILSTIWIQPDNQYLQSLLENRVMVVQLPKWLSLLLSDWTTKEKILSISMGLLKPLVFLLAGVLFLKKRYSWRRAISSANNWLRGNLMTRFIGPDRRKPFTRLLLNWWRLYWHPNLIHIHGYTSDLLFVIEWAYAKRMPVIYEEHQTPDAQFDWWLDFKKSINKATILVAVSQESAKALREVCGVTQPIEVAYCMVPDPHDSGWVEGGQPENKDGQIYVTTSARLYVTKGLKYLLEAIAQIKAIHPTTQFKVYGNGPLRDELLDYAGQLGLDGYQIFVGAYTNQRELSRIMSNTDIFVMSSILEGLPIALLEAMSYGRPIVVTSVGGIPEVIEDNVNGLLCRKEDPGCLAQKICSLIDNPDLRRSLGRAARTSYEQGPFNPSAVCKQFIEIYSEALQQK